MPLEQGDVTGTECPLEKAGVRESCSACGCSQGHPLGIPCQEHGSFQAQ